MAKFTNKNLRLQDFQKITFGTGLDSNVWFDGSQLRLDTTLSGIDPLEACHLATKSYVDAEIATVSGSIPIGNYFDKTLDDTDDITQGVVNLYDVSLDNSVEVRAGVTEVTGKRYTTVSGAISYVNTQAPASILDQWTIILLDKNNSESFTLPNFCSLVSGRYTAGTMSSVLSGNITLGRYSILAGFLLYGNTITITGTLEEPSFFYYNYLYGNISSSVSTNLHCIGSFLDSFDTELNGQMVSLNSILIAGDIVVNPGGALFGNIAKNNYATIWDNGGEITVNSDGAFYDNSTSGLTATSVGDAIDEVQDNIPTSTDELSEGTSNLYDQVVTISSGTNVTIGGTYPDFVITDNSASSSALTSHTNATSIHFTQGEISITESQISDFGDYIPTSEKAASNGVATLDSGGKIPVGQLPNSVMEYKGSWDASTNDPTLVSGTGNAGDVYLCSTSGTQDLGVGDITFAAGDWVVYNGSLWEKSLNSDRIQSVNGYTGVVVLDTDDINETITNRYNIPEENIVKVNQDLSEDKVGVAYTTISGALVYIDTQSPSTSNRWCLEIGAGGYSEDFSVPDWVLVKGVGQNNTVLTGQVTSGGMLTVIPDDVGKNIISDCKIENLYFDDTRSLDLYNCIVTGGSTTAGASSGYFLAYDCQFWGGSWTNLAQIQMIRGYVLGGTFTAADIVNIVGSYLAPKVNNIVLGGTVTLDNTTIWYNYLSYTTTFTDTAHVTTFRNSQYDVFATYGLTAPTFNTSSRTYKFYNTYLGDATYTAGTFYHYNSVASDENTFEKINLVNSVDEFSTDGTFLDNSDLILPTQKAVKTYVDTEITTISGVLNSSIVTDHGNLTGLSDDDHSQYILADGTRSFSSTVGGVTPTSDAHLTTKGYVDGELLTVSGVLQNEINSIVTDHGELTGLSDDDHSQYILVDGTRGFTNTVSGVYPATTTDLATAEYVDDLVGSVGTGLDLYGREAISNAASTVTVSFDDLFTTDYTVNVTLRNTSDSPPSIYPFIVSGKTSSSFTVTFAGEMDSANYYIEWMLVLDPSAF